MKKIMVLMSTYNGERYVTEQIDSVIGQKNVEVQIIVRDDGSIDNTRSILSKYQKEGKLTWYTGENLKPLGSFFHLLFNSQHADYYAFCDQDDVWLPDKLSKSLSVMERNENEHPDIPVLVHTDMSVTDASLNIIHKSFWDNNGICPDVLNRFETLACYNGVNGCTVLLNNAARSLIKKRYFDQDIAIHDVMCTLLVAGSGGIIDYVDEPTMLYRQHENNVVGADNYRGHYYIRRIKAIFSIAKHNYKNYKFINRIKHINLSRYIYYKIKYIFTKKHGIR